MRVKEVFSYILCVFFLLITVAGCSTNTYNKDLLKVAVPSTSPPYGFYDETDNKLIGYDIDIADELAKRLNRKLQVETYTFNRIMYSVISNKVDCGFGSAYRTPEREKVVSFSDTYNFDQTKVALSDNYKDINTLDDLKRSNIKVASRNGTIYASILKKLGFSDSQIVICPEQADLKIMLENGNNMAVATGYKRLEHLKRVKGYKIKFLEPPIVPPQPCGIILNKNNKALQLEINQALKAMKDDGTYDEIATKWFGKSPF